MDAAGLAHVMERHGWVLEKRVPPDAPWHLAPGAGAPGLGADSLGEAALLWRAKVLGQLIAEERAWILARMAFGPSASIAALYTWLSVGGCVPAALWAATEADVGRWQAVLSRCTLLPSPRWAPVMGGWDVASLVRAFIADIERERLSQCAAGVRPAGPRTFL